MTHVTRMHPRCALTNPVEGTVVWSPVKSLWYSFFALTAIVLSPLAFSWSSVLVSMLMTVVTLGAGHSVGFHRLLIHRSFRCPLWLEHVLVTLAVQGCNVPWFGLLSMGEAWHNNHHAFPESARLGLERGQSDPGWWFLCLLRRLSLVRELKLPSDLPVRPELRRLPASDRRTPMKAASHPVCDRSRT